MIIETIELRNQIADEGHWLYQDQAEGFRYFTKKVYLGKNEEPWAECTDADKVAWEEALTAAEEGGEQ